MRWVPMAFATDKTVGLVRSIHVIKLPTLQCFQVRTFITNRIEEGARKNALWRKAALYDLTTGAKIADLPNSEGVRAMDASNDGRFLVSTTWKGTSFQVWDLQARKVVINRVPEGWKRTWDRVLDQIRLSPDSRWLVVGNSVSGDIAVYRFGANNQVGDATK